MVLAAGITTNSFSQRTTSSVIAAAGGISKSNSLVLEWTVGEPVIETATDFSTLYTQGFHQPSIQVLKTQKNNAQESNSVFHVFPNPSSAVINVNFDKVVEVPLLLALVDANGKVLLNNKIPVNSTSQKISVGKYAQGTYFVRVTDACGAIQGECTIIKSL